MIARLRAWWAQHITRGPAPDDLTAHLREARAYGLEQQRQARRSIREMHRIVRALRHVNLPEVGHD